MLVLALAVAHGACPPPEPHLAAATSTSADGAAHVLTRDADVACWWIVDDAGDALLAGRWERARKEPLLYAALPDGRIVAVLRDDVGALRLVTRAEGDGDRRIGALDAPPARLVAHPTRPVVAVVWDAVAWVVDVDSGVWAEVAVVRGAAPRLPFSAGASDGPR